MSQTDLLAGLHTFRVHKKKHVVIKTGDRSNAAHESGALLHKWQQHEDYTLHCSTVSALIIHYSELVIGAAAAAGSN